VLHGPADVNIDELLDQGYVLCDATSLEEAASIRRAMIIILNLEHT